MFRVLFVFLASFVITWSLPQNDYKRLLKPNTPQNLERLKHITKDDLAEELSGQYQGDVVISDAQLNEYRASAVQGYTGIKDSVYRWRDLTVPYWINETYFTEDQIEYIHIGARKLEDFTCLKFPIYDPRIHNDYVTIEGENTGCWSYVGRQGGRQFMNLQPFDREVGCFRLYTIVHEFIHAIGFYHQQSATERDEYVEIVWDKIQEGTAFNFDAYGENIITNYGVEYDYGSVMHYGKTAFSIDGSDTIIPRKDLKGEVLGQRQRLSKNDIDRINRMYCEQPTRPNPIPDLVQAINNFVSNLLKNILGKWR